MWRRKALVAAVVVLLLAEVGVRLLAGSLRDPVVWENAETDFKWHQMADLGDDDGAGTVFVGSSYVGVGIDPARYDELVGGRPSYNAALLSSSIGIWSTWIRDVVVPELRPDRVVIGVSGRELNANDAFLDTADRVFDHAREVRRRRGDLGALEQVDQWLRDASYLFRYRDVLRRPASAFDRTPLPKETAVTDQGMTTAVLDRTFVPYDADDLARFGRLDRFAIDEGAVRQLRELLTWLDDQGVEAVVLDMPQSEPGIAVLPRDEVDAEAWSAVLSATAAQTGARYVAAGIWSTDLFADEWHLNRHGARRLTDLVAELSA